MTGDVFDPASLHRAVSEADTVICCVSYVGTDELCSRRINDNGIQNVADTAAGLGIQRIIYVSTASVYGTGPFRDLPVDGAPVNPQSHASRSRAAGEQHIRDVGGLVIRPHLIHGPGDRWFIPGLLSIIRRLGAVIEDGSALLSTIHVQDLAQAIATLAAPAHFPVRGNIHLNGSEATSVLDILAREHDRTGWSMPSTSISRESALLRAEALGIDRRHIDMISLDHWFRNTLPIRAGAELFG